MKWRNSKERELLANGGSRKQTLPNKNNPNPDLSDANSDKPKLNYSDMSPLMSPQPEEDAFMSSSENNHGNGEQTEFTSGGFEQKPEESFPENGNHPSDELDGYNGSNYYKYDYEETDYDESDEEINVIDYDTDGQ
ncbi:hypothetical protein RUM43_001255 [Polyplax serrata]